MTKWIGHRDSAVKHVIRISATNLKNYLAYSIEVQDCNTTPRKYSMKMYMHFLPRTYIYMNTIHSNLNLKQPKYFLQKNGKLNSDIITQMYALYCAVQHGKH